MNSMWLTTSQLRDARLIGAEVYYNADQHYGILDM